LARYEEALGILQGLTKSHLEGDLNLSMHLAIAHHHLGAREKALQALQQAAASSRPGHPVDLDQRLLLAEVSQLLDDPELSRSLALPQSTEKPAPTKK
jgi:hypothetical protein